LADAAGVSSCAISLSYDMMLVFYDGRDP
jgi:hypothetical protein